MPKKKELPLWLLTIERLVDRAIPWLMIVLAILIVLEFAYEIQQYEPWPTLADSIIVAFFVIDLIFKWHRTRHLKQFFKLYWLDILAVFPFYLLFRLGLFAAEWFAAERIGEAQKVAHEAVLLRETRFLREAELAKETRLAARLIRFGQRLLRGWKAAHKALLHASARHC